jgi:TolA-binding protein
MTVCRQWLLMLSALLAGGLRLLAASAQEDRAYAAAVSAFQFQDFSRAEMAFSNFTARFPASTNAPQATLLQAQAEFKLGKLANAIALLNNRKTLAGNLADQYVYWIGEAQFTNGDFSAAEDTFVSLAQNFPGSPLRLRAVVEAAAARAKLGDWPRAGALLEEAGGVFQQEARLEPRDELVLRGRLLLAQAKFEQKIFDNASAILESLNPLSLTPQLEWQRAHLFCQVKLAAGDLAAALAASTNLLQIARQQNDDGFLADAAALEAKVLALLGRPAEAVAVYREYVTTNAPEKQRQQALLKEAELSLAQGQLTNATRSLEDFIGQFTNSPVRDILLLTLGELNLKAAAGPPPDTNGLQQARARFDPLTNAAPPGLAGRARLDLGWCSWLAGDAAKSLADFEAATNLLSPSDDLAVAKFKIGDVLFGRKDFAGALENYRAVLDDFTNFPNVMQALGAPALYQSLRASLELKNETGASNALARILKDFPSSDLAPGSALLYGEGLADWREPAKARGQFQDFGREFPDSPLRLQAELAVARTFEQETNWTAAIAAYTNWLNDFPTNELRPQTDYALAYELRPQTDYALAWANYEAGNETNALAEFTKFVAQCPTNPLAPLAQWWVADHFFRAGEFIGAETNYDRVYQDWPAATNLVYRAQLMAGRAAVGRLGFSDADRYFTGLIENTNCPIDVRVQATFADGDVLMRMESHDTNNPLANFQKAANAFNQICLLSPTNEAGALAFCKIGDCDLQLTSYAAATNAYAQVFANTNSAANVSLRSRAQIGFGIALEKMAALASGTNQTALLRLALDNYLDVFDTWTGKNLHDGETADQFWVEKAGLQALPLIQALGSGDPDRFIDRMESLFPQSKDSLEKIRATLPPRDKS